MGGLQAPDWQPEEVRQGGGAIRGSSQELLTDQVLLLAVVVHACTYNIVQVLPEELINMKLALFDYVLCWD